MSARLTTRFNGFVYAGPKKSNLLTTRLDKSDNTWRVLGSMVEAVFDGVFDDSSTAHMLTDKGSIC